MVLKSGSLALGMVMDHDSLHLPKAVSVPSNQGSGCNIRCDRRRTKTWSGVIRTDPWSLWGPKQDQ